MIHLIRRFFPVLALSAAACAATVAPVTSPRVSVSLDQIATALVSEGLEVNSTQLQLLSNVTSIAGATVHLTKLNQESAGTILAEFGCRRRQCLPFYVLMHDVHTNNKIRKSIDQTAAGKSPVTNPLIRRGKPVTLMLEGSNCRITVPAISLEHGMQGQVIRVASLDHKRTFHAEVINETTVRSTL